jgi:hypothetical protein
MFEGKYHIIGKMEKNGEVIDYTGAGFLENQTAYFSMVSEYSDGTRFNGFMVLNDKTGYSAAHDKSKIAYINIKILKCGKLKAIWATVDAKIKILIKGTEEWTKI